jgi:hypothetical protein
MTDRVDGAGSRGEKVTIELGDICLGIHCEDRDFMGKMLNDYRPFLVRRGPDFRIFLKLSDRLSDAEIKGMLNNIKTLDHHDGLFNKPGLLEIEVDWTQAVVRVNAEKGLLAPTVGYKLFNHLMCGIYAGVYAYLKNTLPAAYLLHGCGIVDRERSYLFTGPSGAGKTTIARLAQGRKILNDEAVLVGKNENGIRISGTPLEGGQAEKCNESAELSAIFFLKHAKQASLQRLSKVDTYLRLLSQIFSTSPLFEVSGDTCLRKRSKLSAEMATVVPAFELSFRPDSSFWQVVEAI